MKAIVIAEAISTALFYEQDILDRGYLPIVIYPHIRGDREEQAVYEGIRDACRKRLSDRTVETRTTGISGICWTRWRLMTLPAC